MKYEKVKELIKSNKDFVNFADFGNGVSDYWIHKAENRLGVVFPGSYKWWLKNYSCGEIMHEEIFSIYEMDNVVGGDIVYMNELNQKNGFSKKNELVIQETDFGETYYFKIDEEENGECPIYEMKSGKKYSDNFIDFLIKKINEVINDMK